MKLDPDLAGPGVLQHVGHGLLRDPQQVLLHLLREGAGCPRDVHVHLYAGSGGPHSRSRFQGGRQVLPLEREALKSITERRASVRLCRAMRRARSRKLRAGVISSGMHMATASSCEEIDRKSVV